MVFSVLILVATHTTARTEVVAAAAAALLRLKSSSLVHHKIPSSIRLCIIEGFLRLSTFIMNLAAGASGGIRGPKSPSTSSPDTDLVLY